MTHSRIWETQSSASFIDMTIKTDLKIAHSYITAVLERIEANEKVSETSLVDLIRACERVDAYYKQFCAECDADWGDDEGSAYRDGVSLEFQIEADWWHSISLALRKLKEESK